MNAVGIDVSKGKSMAAALRPMGEVALTPREFPHTAVELENLAPTWRRYAGHYGGHRTLP